MGKWEMALMRGQGINRALVCGIILLGSVHVLFTIGLYGMSRSGVFSNYHDGMGTWNVLSDNRGDQLGAIKLASLLKKNELASWWAVGDTSKTVRDIGQLELMGPMNAIGTGFIPRHRIEHFSRKPGVTDAIETVWVQHVEKAQGAT